MQLNGTIKLNILLFKEIKIILLVIYSLVLRCKRIIELLLMYLLVMDLPFDEAVLFFLFFVLSGNVYIAVDFLNRRILEEFLTVGGDALWGFGSFSGLRLLDNGHEGGAD